MTVAVDAAQVSRDRPTRLRFNQSQTPVLFEKGFTDARSQGLRPLSIFDLIRRLAEVRQAARQLLGRDENIEFHSGTIVFVAAKLRPFGNRHEFKTPSGAFWGMDVPAGHDGRYFLIGTMNPGDYDLVIPPGEVRAGTVVQVTANRAQYDELVASAPYGVSGLFPLSRIAGVVGSAFFWHLELATPRHPQLAEFERYGRMLTPFDFKAGTFCPVSLRLAAGDFSDDVYLMSDWTSRYSSSIKRYMILEPAP